MSAMRESFQRDLAEVEWRELRIHLQRDAIILVSSELDLIDVAVAVADDDKKRVEEWLDSALLGKPDAGQLASWESELSRPFRMLIVQPFILVQDVLHA
ncbi:MAG: DUF2288 family protein [Desulfuromonadales bacterium]|nr:DUF2288 family protein [Desulfuromonadales bacterium]MBN2791324.1 DUF2288 family protein [Desulfuromonadales bacterium]